MTLLELMIVVTITGLLAVMAVPKYHRAIEQAKVDRAMTQLRTVWAAQRLYRLDHPEYAPDLATLQTAGLLDSDIVVASDPFGFVIQLTPEGFVVQANRQGSAVWSGMFQLDQTGQLVCDTCSEGTGYCPPGCAGCGGCSILYHGVPSIRPGAVFRGSE
jgi:type II secretory pathway pseudopilin PulG